MNKKSLLWKLMKFGIFFSGLFAIVSCGEDSGLGSSIDTKAPTLSISYPPAGAAIRSSFVLAGSCSDDKTISKVMVTVKNLETSTDYGSYIATIAPDQASWQVTLNGYDENNGAYFNGWQYPDGKYEVSVTAYDNAGNNSGVSSRTFEIDNTPPVFIISNPGVVKSSGLSASAYGSLFTIDGTISDNHTISFMDVKIFDKDGNIVSAETYDNSSIDFYRESDIATAGGSSVQIAQYSSASASLNSRYSQLHPGDSGTEQYYAQIKLYDSTQIYQNPPVNSARSAADIAADAYGNSTSKLYLYDDVYTSLMSVKKGLGLSAANLKDIIAKVDTGSKSAQALAILNENVKDTGASDGNRLSFTLNPQANPTYNVNGFKFVFGEGTATQLASSGNNITITVSAGLDGTNVAPEVVKVWMKTYSSKPSDENALKAELRKLNQKVTEWEKDGGAFNENSTKLSVESADDWLLIYDYSAHNDKGSSVTTKTFSATLPEGIELSKYYIIGVSGHDIEDVDFSQDIVYGFEGNAAGVPPTITVETPESLTVHKDFATPVFSGTATVSNASYSIKELTAKLTVTNETTGATVGTYTDTMTHDTVNGEVQWIPSSLGAITWNSSESKWYVDASKLCTADSNVYWLATLEVSGKSSSGHTGSASRDIHIDTVAPKVTLTSITPSVSGAEYFGNSDTNSYFNGKITIKGNVEEQNLLDGDESEDAVTYDVWASTNLSKTLTAEDSILSGLIARKDEFGIDFDGKLGRLFSLDIPFATTAITKYFGDTDQKIQVELIITATDKARNTGSCSSKTLNGGKNFIIYQETDRPKISFGNADSGITTADGIDVNHNLFGTTNNRDLQISFSDDDSVNTVFVTLYDEKGEKLDDTKTSYGLNPYSLNPKKTTFTLNYRLPETEGKYQVRIDAYDENLVSTDLTDSNSVYQKTVGKFFIAVDSGAPNIEISNPVAGSYQSGTVNVSGTVSKKEGVTITGAIEGASNTSATISDVTIGNYDAASKSYPWNGTITLPTTATGNYTLTYTATDGYGQTSSSSKAFVVDITAPTFKITDGTGDNYSVFTAEDVHTVKGTISDGDPTSGIKGFYYSLSEPTEENGSYTLFNTDGKTLLSNWHIAAVAATPTKGYTFTANVDLTGISSTDGTTENTVYFAVCDEAGNISKISDNKDSSNNNYSNGLKITRDTVAPRTTLLGTGLKKPSNKVESSETGTKDEAENLILDADSTIDETITYYATGEYSLSGVVTEASNTVTVKVDGTDCAVSGGIWTFNGKTTDGTYTHKIVVTDKAGNSVTRNVSVIRDAKIPELNITNALASNAIITEKNSSHSVDDSSGKHYYTLSGKWSDATSGTYKLQYRVSPKYENGTYSNAWSEWREVSDVTQSTAESTWSAKIEMTEGYGIGQGVGIQGRAIDAAGNIKETAEITGLTLDFSVPTISVTNVKVNDVSKETTIPDYVKAGETLTIIGTYGDSYGVDSVTCVAKKDGTEVSSGYTFEAINADADSLGLVKSGTFTITVEASDSNNGSWTFDLAVKDKANRETKLSTLKTFVDTKKPEWKDDYADSPFRVNNKVYSSGTDHSWYNSSSLPFQGAFTEEGSGIDLVYYSIISADGTNTVPTESTEANQTFSPDYSFSTKDLGSVETFKANLGDFTKKMNGDTAVPNKIYFKAVDKAGNESEIKSFDIYIDNESPNLESNKNGTVYSRKIADITVNGTMRDDASGAAGVVLTVTDNAAPTVVIATITATLDSTTEWSANLEGGAADSGKLLSTLTDGHTYSVKATVTDKAGNSSSSTIFKIQVDTTPPTIGSNITVSDTKDSVDPYYNKTEDKYYIHNADGNKFTIAGSASDAVSGVASVKLEVENTVDSNKKLTPPDVNNGAWSFSGLDMSDWEGGATVTITATDEAGNESKSKILNLVFDNAAPLMLHKPDSKNKDIYFRIGENDSERKTTDTTSADYNRNEADDAWDNTLDKDVGGKYSFGSYGNANTIKVRGTVYETGSGVKMIYYKQYTTAPDVAALSSFLSGYENNADGYFGLLKTAEKRRVTYNTDSGKKSVEIHSNFNTTLADFKEGKNFLVFAIVDNVGNVALDTLAVNYLEKDGAIADIATDGAKLKESAADSSVGTSTWNKTGTSSIGSAYYAINVDTAVPAIETNVTNSILTNAKLKDSSVANTATVIEKDSSENYIISGTVTDSASGIKSLVIEVGEENDKKTISKDDSTYGTISWTSLADESVDTSTVQTWTVTLKKGLFSESTTTYPLYLVATDNAGTGNTQRMNVATIVLDTLPPTVTLATPTDADTSTAAREINGIIDLSGTVKDANPLPETSIVAIQYIKKDDYTTANDDTDTGWTTLTNDEKGEMTNLSLSGDYTFDIKNFDTTKIEPLNDVVYYIRAKATDQAGNIGYSPIKDSNGNFIEITISQDSDRPVIKLTNLTDLGAGANPRFVLKYGTKSQVIATVDDDDGIDEVYFSESEYKGNSGEAAPSSDMSNYSSTNGTVTFTPQADITQGKNVDGSKSFYVYVKDKAGNVFYTTYYASAEAAATAKYLNSPKVKLGDFHANTSDIQKFSYQSDSTSPVIENIQALAYKSDGKTKNGGAVVTGSGETATIEYTDFESVNASYIIGGTEKQKTQFKLTASDASGIDGIALEISYTEVDGTTETPKVLKYRSKDSTSITDSSYIENGTITTDTSDSTKSTWTTEIIDFSKAKTGSVSVKVIPYDKLGLVGNGNATFVVDNSAPPINITAPASGAEKTGAVSIVGTSYDGNSGTSNIQWLIPTQTEVSTANAASTESARFEYLKNLKVTVDGTKKSKWNGGTASLASGTSVSVSSWQFDFDGNYDSTKSNASNFIFASGNPKLDLYDSATFASSNSNGVYTIPIYFMATDSLGNYTIEENYVICHNPDGDRPKVEFTYPTKKDYDSGLSYITLGGTIRVTGSAEIPSNTTTVKNVYLQIADSAAGFTGTVASASGTTDEDKLTDSYIAKNKYLRTIVSAYDVINEIKGTSYNSESTFTDAELKALGFSTKTDLDNWWGIKTNGTASWNIALNDDGKMNPTGDSTNKITIRACGVNAEGKFGAWTQGDNLIAIHIDNKAPTVTYAVNQYSSAVTASNASTTLAASVSQAYEPDMFLRGQWYLVLDILDESGIETLTVRNSSRELTKGTDYFAVNLSQTDPSKTGFKVFVKVDKTATSETYTVTAIDRDTGSSPHTTTQTFSFNIDNTAPSMDNITANGAAFSSENLVQNTNYKFTLAGKSTDEGSGVERVVFYYMRKYGTTTPLASTSDANDVILDPMVKPAGDDYSAVKVSMKDTSIVEKLEIEQDSSHKYELYAQKISGTATTTTFTGSFDAHVRVGGLVTFDKTIYRRITAKTDGSVTFEPALTSISGITEAYFPIAQVIDNSATEKTSSDSANPFTFEKGDDGDLMPESFSKSGKTWTWDASIHSDNLPDGPVTLVILAFDVAGNINGATINTFVSNNAPRVAKLYLATDLNDNNKFETDEFEEYSIIGKEGKAKDKYTIDFADFGTEYGAGVFTAKNKLAVVPEIVGGNKSIKLVAKKDAGDETAVTTANGTELSSIAGKTAANTSATGLTAASGTQVYSVTADSFAASAKDNKFWAYVLTNADLSGITAFDTNKDSSEGRAANEAADGSGKNFSFTFWDETEETTQGTNSQNAVVLVKGFSFDLTDGEAPKVVVNPFYWQSLNSNSIYGSTSASTVADLKGHIELESDLTDDLKASGNDPKVSGKITFTGTAYDEHSLGSLKFTFSNGTEKPFEDVTIASYDKTSSKWKLYGDASTKSVGTDGYEAKIEVVKTENGKTTDTYGVYDDKVYFGQKGHKIYWTLSIDTEKISTTEPAASDMVLTVLATDLAGNSTSTAEDKISAPSKSENYIPGQELSDTVTYTVTDGTTNYPIYQMDVVPYITEVKTSLTSLKKKNPSVYTRTALGHYTVRNDETVTFSGFNLGSSTTLSMSTLSASGKYDFAVSGITAVNNSNNNNSRGCYATEISDTSSYSNKNRYAYNRIPNNDNNNLLTDDVYFDIWEFDSDHVVPISGKIEQPVMKINPNNDKVGFAFVNGPLYFSMGGGTGHEDYSYRYWMGSYDFFTSVGFTYDKLGYSYGVAAGGDINSKSADKFQLMTSRWGHASREQSGSYASSNSLRLESIGQKGDSAGNNTGTRNFDKQRFQSPSLATAVHSDKTYLYMAYYDQMNDEIRFRAGSTNSTSAGNFGSFTDTESAGDSYTYAAGASTVVQMVAGSNTGRNAGGYVSIGVVSKQESTVDDVVVMVWYDATKRCLMYSYNDTPTTNRQGNKKAAGWSTPVRVFDEESDMANTGEYCKIAVDNDGGIHIACYDPVNLDLNYAYLPSAKGGKTTDTSDFETCVVDSNGVTGSNITLDVAKVGTNWIPYIGYYMTSCIKPKLAYKVDTASSAPAGSNDDSVTGSWEITIVPTSKTVEMQSNQHNDINVALWKNKDTGVIKTSLTTTSTSNSNKNDAKGYDSDSYGQIYGNGKTDANGNLYPILGYAVKYGSTGDHIETAQMK